MFVPLTRLGASRPAARCTHREGEKTDRSWGLHHAFPRTTTTTMGCNARRFPASTTLCVFVLVVVVLLSSTGNRTNIRSTIAHHVDVIHGSVLWQAALRRIVGEVKCRGGGSGGDPMLAGAYSPSNAAGEREERTTAALQSARGVATQPSPRASRSRVLAISLSKLNEIVDFSSDKSIRRVIRWFRVVSVE